MATAQQSIAHSYNLIDGKMVECPKNKGKYITSNYLSYGDYDNSTDVHRSNVAYIEQNYTTNRYHIVYGGWGYTHLYLKNTKINSEFICSLDEYPVINDGFYYQWQTITAKTQFNDSYIKDYPVINDALTTIDNDKDWTISDKIYECLQHFSELWNDGESYHWDGNCYYFSLMHDRYNTDVNRQLVTEWFIDNGVYSKLRDTELILEFSLIIDRLHADSQLSTNDKECVYCLQLLNYQQAELYSGSADYMTTHEYPFQEFTIYNGSSRSNIILNLISVYNTICNSSYEQLDYLPI